MGEQLSGVGALPLVAVLGAIVLLMIFLTELTSNTASTATFLPILASLAIGIGQDPMLLLVPAVVAASCAFMMPVATPPNAIVFASGVVGVPRMAKAGLVLNLLFALLLPLLTGALVGLAFGARAGVLPPWTGMPGG
jgi:sodium-dependent dicarboxylate transporter 2/3/5